MRQRQAAPAATEAEIAARRAAAMLRPRDAAAHHALGRALLGTGRAAEAVAPLRAAVALRPGHPAAHADLGLAFARAGRMADAVEAFRAAVRLAPADADAHANLGVALGKLGRPADAAVALGAAIRLRPGHADAHSNLGVVLAGLDRPAEAAAACARAIALRPGHADAHANLGLALLALSRFEEAITAFERAVAIEPAHANARLNLALALLLLGRFDRGWQAFEHRHLVLRAHTAGRGVPRLQWRGEPLGGRTVLLHAEQGLGDTVQFARYAPLVAGRSAGRVLLLAQPPLLRLLAGLPGVDRVLAPGDPLPPFDLHCPLPSLPFAFRTTLGTIPAAVPYLRPVPEAEAGWHARLAPLGDLRVGLVWAGNPGHVNDRNRSVPFAALAPLWRVPGVSWVSLQVGPRSADLAGQDAAGAVLDVAPLLGDFADTAATAARLDLVVSVDTATAHLAGALGRPVWLMLPHVPDWRWMLGREDSPWYPSMRLFRQARPGDWAGVVTRVAAELVRCQRPMT